jgi:hypothetical protein
MLTLEDIREWWERKIINYIKNYARRNRLTLIEARAQFFSETHEWFLEAIPEALFTYLNQPNVQTHFRWAVDAQDHKWRKKKLKWVGREDCEEYIEDQAVEDRESVQTIKNKFYTELHDGFLCTVPSLLHKFLLDKGVKWHCRVPTPLEISPSKLQLEKRQEEWEVFLEANCKDTREAWEYFLKKWAYKKWQWKPSTVSKLGRRRGDGWSMGWDKSKFEVKDKSWIEVEPHPSWKSRSREKDN